MAGETVQSSVEELIPEIIEQRVLPAAFQRMVFEPALGPSHAFDFTGIGDNHNIVQEGTLSFGALTEATEDSFSEFTTTQRQLLPVYLGDTLIVSNQARTRSAQDPVGLISRAAALAWAQLTDSDTTYGFAHLYLEASASPDHEIGTNGVPLDYTVARQIVQLLMTAKAIFPINWFIDPIQWSEMNQDSVMRDALKGTTPMPSGMNEGGGSPNMAYFVGQPIVGLNIWAVPGGMEEASGLHSIAVGQSAIGIGYENVNTPLSPSPSRMNLDIQWNARARGWEVAITVSQDVGGLAWTATTNKWMVDAIS